MSVIPPRAPIAAEKYWRSTETYNQAQGRIHQHQKHAKLLLSYHDGQETPALRLSLHFPGNTGPCGSFLLSIGVRDRVEALRRMASGEVVSRRD
jgi:hypothetical protein